MVESGEIMVGNFFKHQAVWSWRQNENEYKEFDFQWTEADWYQIGECCISLENIDPIPLTEEWLLNFGCDKKNDRYLVFENNSEKSKWFIKRYKENKWSVYLFVTGHPDFQIHIIRFIEHVHQFQNIHLALTGEKLNLVKNNKKS
jgi:hypothetical protein